MLKTDLLLLQRHENASMPPSPTLLCLYLMTTLCAQAVLLPTPTYTTWIEVDTKQWAHMTSYFPAGISQLTKHRTQNTVTELFVLQAKFTALKHRACSRILHHSHNVAHSPSISCPFCILRTARCLLLSREMSPMDSEGRMPGPVGPGKLESSQSLSPPHFNRVFSVLKCA